MHSNGKSLCTLPISDKCNKENMFKRPNQKLSSPLFSPQSRDILSCANARCILFHRYSGSHQKLQRNRPHFSPSPALLHVSASVHVCVWVCMLASVCLLLMRWAAQQYLVLQRQNSFRIEQRLTFTKDQMRGEKCREIRREKKHKHSDFWIHWWNVSSKAICRFPLHLLKNTEKNPVVSEKSLNDINEYIHIYLVQLWMSLNAECSWWNFTASAHS